MFPGFSGQPEHPLVRQCLQEILAGVNDSPVDLGIVEGRAQEARYISINLESLLEQSMQEFPNGVGG